MSRSYSAVILLKKKKKKGLGNLNPLVHCKVCTFI